jgi:hypothetical protein
MPRPYYGITEVVAVALLFVVLGSDGRGKHLE